LLTIEQNILEYATRRAKLLENKSARNIAKLYRMRDSSQKKNSKSQNKREMQSQKYWFKQQFSLLLDESALALLQQLKIK